MSGPWPTWNGGLRVLDTGSPGVGHRLDICAAGIASRQRNLGSMAFALRFAGFVVLAWGVYALLTIGYAVHKNEQRDAVGDGDWVEVFIWPGLVVRLTRGKRRW